MIIDMTYFGYGAGIILAGWFLGMCIKFLFSALSRGF